MTKQPKGNLTRRDFLKRAAGAAAAVTAASAGLGASVPAIFAAPASAKPGLKHRTLGRTKLKVSELGLGTIRTGSASVIHRALDLGINYFDTAECYREGNGEIDLGKALKGRRDKAIVATKWHPDGASAKDLVASLDGSLRRLGMDHVELIQIHGAGSAAQVQAEQIWEAFTAARKAGKVRFNGLSTHGGQVEVIRAAIKTGWYDAVLPGHSAYTAGNIAPVLAEAKQAKLGVIVMKALAPAHEGRRLDAFKGLKGNPYQQAIQWVLKDPNVSTVIVDMPSHDELEEDYAAVANPVSLAELQAFETAVASFASGSCHLCGACTGQCKYGVRVADIMRHLLYHDGYGDRAYAVARYRELPVSAAPCADCTSCPVICPWGVPVRARMERARTVLV
jgi:aryl-alcohol dehydrogenase-like predicted oxidoreductase